MAKAQRFKENPDGSLYEVDLTSGKALNKNLASVPSPDEYQMDSPTKDVTVVSSKLGKNIVDDAAFDQTNDELKLKAFNEKQSQSTLPEDPKDKNKQTGGYTYDEAKEFGIDLNNSDYDPKSGKFVPTTDSGESARADRYKADLDEIDRAFAPLDSMFDDATSAVIRSIKGTYSQLSREQQDRNKRQLATFKNFGIREGAERYGGEVMQGILNSEERAGLRRIMDITSEENSKVAAAKQALAEKQYTVFLDKRAEVNELRKKRQEEIDELNKKAMEKREKAEEARIQVSRDEAVAGLLRQGITDPKELLNYLNYNEAGDQIGDFTAEEIKTSLESLSGGNIDKLSGDIRDYYILKENGTLPKTIASLPEDEQLMAFRNLMSPKKVGTGSGGNKITLTEAKSQNLPLAVVGMSESELAASFTSDTPPDWFAEKVEAEYQRSTGPDVLRSMWNEYRTAYVENRDSDVKVSMATDYTDRAKKYFTDTFGEAVDDATADTLAQYVQQYVDGGMTYAKAVEKVQEDASE